MPPQPARSITSYFAKAPTSPTAQNAAAATTSTTSSTAQSVSKAGNGVATISTHTTTVSGPSSSPSTSTSGVKRQSFLSDAAKRAIEEGVAEGTAAKKAKLTTSSSPQKVADIFAKPSFPPKLAVPKATSRADLRMAFATQPKLIENLALELDTLGEDWLLALQDELTKAYFLTLKEFVRNEQRTRKVFPPPEDIYSWSRLTPLKDVRVVIIGQDPYHDDLQAHGLAFSVRKGIRIPPSLRNIYKEMADEVPGFKIPLHGDLTPWAKHGVLLLNSSLTVRAHEAASHSGKGWDNFTAAVLRVVIERLAPSTSSTHVPGAKGVVFMAWGAHAQKMTAGVDKSKHLILKSAHPSPLSANRGFFGNAHFKKANEWLEERYGPGGGIDWVKLGKEQAEAV